MIFDKLCGFSERHLPELKGLLADVKIFKLDKPAHVLLKGFFHSKTEEELQDISETFFLPYPNIAIEDPSSCIILFDTEENQTGIGGFRRYLEVLHTGTSSTNFDDPKDEIEAWELKKAKSREPDRLILIFGIAENVRLTAKVTHMAGKVTRYLSGNKKEFYDHTPTLKDNETKAYVDKNSLQNIITAYNELIYFNRPDRFILRTTHAKKQKIKSGRLKRAHQRPVYTILHPSQIRNKIGLTTSHGSSGVVRTAHERRRHWRYLSDDKYKYDQSGDVIEPKTIPTGERRGELYYKRVNVPASWVGPSENRVGNKIYKVILDR